MESKRTSYWVAAAGVAVALLLVLGHPVGQSEPVDQLSALWRRTFQYILFAVVAFGIFWVALDRLMAGRRLSRTRWPKTRQVLSEAVFSSVTNMFAVAIGLWLGTWLFSDWLIPNLYRDIGEYGWGYYAICVLGIFLIHDTAFYWSHRLMHWQPLFDRLHKTHHESRDPTPFTTFHFHPAEAVVEVLAAWAIVIPMAFLPWHISLLPVWFFGMLIFNTLGHLGYEIYPRWWHRIPILRMKTTCTHHYLHHQLVGGNYALYFRFWDKICGTEFPDYEARFDHNLARKSEKETGKPAKN